MTGFGRAEVGKAIRGLLLIGFGVFAASGLQHVSGVLDSGFHDHRVRWADGWNWVEVVADDGVEFTDDDRDVARLGFDGYLRVEQSRNGTTRRYEVKAGPDGEPLRLYWVAGQPRPLDADARAWIATMMPRAIRDSGLGAPARVQRLLRERGPDGVLSEVRLIRNGGVQRTYLRELIENGSLPPADVRRVLENGVRAIQSDGQKTGLLLDVADRFLSSELRPAFFTAVDAVRSSGDRTHLLRELLWKPGRDSGVVASVLSAAEGIDSGGDRAHLLAEAAELYSAEATVRQAFFDAADSIASSGDHAQALTALAQRATVDAESLAALCRSAARIVSDGEKASVLAEAARHLAVDGDARAAFFRAVESVRSSGERTQVLVRAVTGGPADDALLEAAARTAATIESDGDKARVLEELARRARTDAVRTAVQAAAATIRSEGDRGRVLGALEP